MVMPCEKAVKSLLPAIRASVAKELTRKNLTQVEIASVLGLTQAAVSKYLLGHYTEEIKALEKTKQFQTLAKKIARSIVNEKAKKSPASSFCRACQLCRR